MNEPYLGRPADPQDIVVAAFALLEAQLQSLLEYVPFIHQNESVVSPRAIPILMEACSLIDSVLRDSFRSTGRSPFRELASTSEPVLQLDDCTSLMLVSPLRLVRPFCGWTTTVPRWWQAYNKVKHDRLANFAEGVLCHSVEAVAGLHQVLARSSQLTGNLIKAGWFNEEDSAFESLVTNRAAGVSPPEIAAESRLFVSPVRGQFVDWSQDPPSVEYWGFSERVKNRIWEEEGW